MKSFSISLIIVLFLVIGISLVKPVLLAGRKSVALSSAPQLEGQIAQSLVSKNSLFVPVPEKDFNLKDTYYYENTTWAVTSINGIGNTVTSGYAVLEKKNGMFQVVLGPGSAFPNSYKDSLPASVTDYLQSKGVLYGSAN